MFSVPFLGSESLSPEPRTRFYAGLEVTTFISAPASKFDVGRLASKRQGNHLLSVQQESLASLSWVAGMGHGCAKAPAAEQAFNGLKTSSQSLDAAKASQKAPNIQYFAGGKPPSLKSSRLKLPIQNFEEQLAVLERIHLQSQASGNGPESLEDLQVSRKFDISPDQQKENNHSTIRLENQASKCSHASFQQSLEKQFKPPGSCVEESRAGLVCAEQIVEVNLTGHEPILNEPFSVHGKQASKNHALGPSLGSNEQISQPPNYSRINGSDHSNLINGTESKEEEHELQQNAQKIEAYRTGRCPDDSIECVDNEEYCTRGENLMNSFRSSRSGSHTLFRYPADQTSRSANGMNVNGFHVKKQGYGVECANADEKISTSVGVGMQTKESLDVFSVSCKVAFVRMPVYRKATPLQRSLSESIFYLESLGVDCSRLFRDDPTTMKCTVKQLRTLACALERYGLKSNDFGRIFNLCPKILHMKLDGDLKAVTSFLFDEVGLLRKDLGKVIRRCPRLLVADIHEQVRPTLSFLRNLGYLKMGQVVSNNPTLLSFSVERKLIPKLRFLESLGFTYREAASMVVRFPAIFNYSISDNLQPKYDYLVHVMGGRNKDLLAFPQYFGYSLETRIQPRHECIARLDVSLSIQAILKLSDVEFNARFLPVGGQERPLSASPETSSATLQDFSLDSVQFASFEHSKFRTLVSV